MENTALLCHINIATLQLWESVINKNYALNNPEKTMAILGNFIDFLSNCKNPIFLSFEQPGFIADEIKKGLKNNFIELPFSHELTLLKNIFKNQDIYYVYYLDSIYGIIDAGLTEKLYHIHNEYSADYSFIENGPPGITGVFFNRSLFEAMEIEQNEKSQIPTIDNAIPDSMPVPLKEYLEKNINHFHVEIHYEHPDLRMIRLDYSGKSLRSILSTTDVFAKYSKTEDYYRELEGLYTDNPAILHHFPSYMELEIFGGCEYACTFCARQFTGALNGQMLSLTDIKTILKFASQGLQDTSVAFGGQGEPLEHPDINEILNLVLSEKSVPVVILETNGKYLDKIFQIVEHDNFQKLRIVININGLKNYAGIHGTNAENKQRVLNNIEGLAEIAGKKNTSFKKNIFIQTLKILENESELDEVYDYADKTGISFLLQKYNSYAGLMPEKRVSDMTPLERFFCWHLRRDLFIRANGNVVYCKQDITNSTIRGNIKTGNLHEIWKSCSMDWQNNYRNNFPAAPDCANCDEYYTFNM